MDTLNKYLNDNEKEIIEERDIPKKIEPMLATLTHEHFSDDDWIFERKLDGERCVTYCKNNKIYMKSRNDKDLNNQYPELVEKLQEYTDKDFIIDGEIVAFDGDITSFSKLQNRMHVNNPDKDLLKDVPVYYYIFDIMYIDKYDISNLPLTERKSILKSEFSFDDPIRFTSHRNTEGEEYLEEACKKDWEGLIAKKRDGKYIHSRSKKWLKFKCGHRQEFVIGGYTDPQGERIGFGALLIGYYDGNDLIYAGKVGTGYDDETLDRISKQLKDLEKDTSPLKGEVKEKGVHWVKPKLVGEVGFSEWTNDNKLRHPRFKGLRKDKDPKDVVREG